MTIAYAPLRTELLIDPLALGYAPTTDGSRDAAIADLLNTVSTGHRVSVGVLPSYLLVNEIDWSERGLVASFNEAVNVILSAGQVDPDNSFVRQAFAGAFSSTTATRTRLVNLARRSGSRAEVLFGSATMVEPVHVGLALRWTT